MFYVYELIDPRDNQPFYVGKGKGNRIDAHEKEAHSGVVGLKCDYIREIWEAEGEVIKKKVKTFSNEDKAYKFEAEHIESVGIDNLTNIVPGGWGGRMSTNSKYFGSKQEARDSIQRIARGLKQCADYSVLCIPLGSVVIEISVQKIRDVLKKAMTEVADRIGEDETTRLLGQHGIRAVWQSCDYNEIK